MCVSMSVWCGGVGVGVLYLWVCISSLECIIGKAELCLLW